MSDKEIEVEEVTEEETEEDLWAALSNVVVVFANASAVNLNRTDIAISYGATFGDSGLDKHPSARIVMPHENFMSNIEMLLPYYVLLRKAYGERRPILPSWESPEYRSALDEANKKHGVTELTETTE